MTLGSHDWTPISPYGGSSSTAGYKGTFDGNGHTVANVCAKGTELTQYGSTSISGAGFFGSVAANGTVKNLTVSGQMEAVQYAGGIVAALNGGRVEACTNRVNITAENMTNKNAFTGGVVGAMINSSSKTATVIGCKNYGTISGGTNSYLGGIVGSASYGACVENCVNEGTVTGKTSLGGIVGRNAGVPIRNCAITRRSPGPAMISAALQASAMRPSPAATIRRPSPAPARRKASAGSSGRPTTPTALRGRLPEHRRRHSHRREGRCDCRQQGLECHARRRKLLLSGEHLRAGHRQ